MKVFKVVSVLLLLLLSSAVLLSGCGTDTDDAKALGCPSGTALASHFDLVLSHIDKVDVSDTITYSDPRYTPFTIPATATSPTMFSMPVGAALVLYVVDNANLPKNDICVVLDAPGYFWNDASYSTLHSAGRLVAKTNAHGFIDVYYSSTPLLASAPASTTGDGAPQTTENEIHAWSGSAKDFVVTVAFTVRGCSASSTTPCP